MTQPALSVQLYAVNSQLTEDLDGTLARLAGMGLRNVEAFEFVSRAPELAEAFARHGLVAKTGHAMFLSDERRRGDVVTPAPAQQDVFEAAQTLGVDILIDPFVPLERWLDEDQVAATAARLNQAAERAADYGLRVGYHNHTQEFAAYARRPLSVRGVRRPVARRCRARGRPLLGRHRQAGRAGAPESAWGIGSRLCT